MAVSPAMSNWKSNWKRDRAFYISKELGEYCDDEMAAADQVGAGITCPVLELLRSDRRMLYYTAVKKWSIPRRGRGKKKELMEREYSAAKERFIDVSRQQGTPVHDMQNNVINPPGSPRRHNVRLHVPETTRRENTHEKSSSLRASRKRKVRALLPVPDARRRTVEDFVSNRLCDDDSPGTTSGAFDGLSAETADHNNDSDAQKMDGTEGDMDNSIGSVDVKLGREEDDRGSTIAPADPMEDEPEETDGFDDLDGLGRQTLCQCSGEATVGDPGPPCQWSSNDALVTLLGFPGNRCLVRRSLRNLLEDTVRKIPDDVWKGREDMRSTDNKAEHEILLGLRPAHDEEFGGPTMATINTWRWQGLCALALLYLTVAVEELPKDFCVTSIQMTKNLKTKISKDTNTTGRSYILLLGDFQGGGTFVERGSPWTRNDFRVKENVIRKVRDGQAVVGDVYLGGDIPLPFDGRLYHEAEEFSGERIAIVFFCGKLGLERTPAVTRAYLEGLGFRFPDHIPRRRILRTDEEMVRTALNGRRWKQDTDGSAEL